MNSSTLRIGEIDRLKIVSNEGNIGQVNKDEPLAQDFTPAVRFSSRPFSALVGERRTSAGEDHR